MRSKVTKGIHLVRLMLWKQSFFCKETCHQNSCGTWYDRNLSYTLSEKIGIGSDKPGVNFSHTGRNLLSSPISWGLVDLFESVITARGSQKQPGEPLNIMKQIAQQLVPPPKKKQLQSLRAIFWWGSTLVVFFGPSDFHDRFRVPAASLSHDFSQRNVAPTLADASPH